MMKMMQSKMFQTEKKLFENQSPETSHAMSRI